MDLPARSLRVKDRRELYLPMVVVYLMVATLVAIVLYPHMVVTVPSGYVGVLWKRFGGGLKAAVRETGRRAAAITSVLGQRTIAKQSPWRSASHETAMNQRGGLP